MRYMWKFLSNSLKSTLHTLVRDSTLCTLSSSKMSDICTAGICTFKLCGFNNMCKVAQECLSENYQFWRACCPVPATDADASSLLVPVFPYPPYCYQLSQEKCLCHSSQWHSASVTTEVSLHKVHTHICTTLQLAKYNDTAGLLVSTFNSSPSLHIKSMAVYHSQVLTDEIVI